MTKDQHLLNILAEECNEVGQRAIKAVRFGLDEIQPGQTLTNRERIELELGDLMGLADMLGLTPNEDSRKVKPHRVERYMKLSLEFGQLGPVKCEGCNQGDYCPDPTCPG